MWWRDDSAVKLRPLLHLVFFFFKNILQRHFQNSCLCQINCVKKYSIISSCSKCHMICITWPIHYTESGFLDKILHKRTDCIILSYCATNEAALFLLLQNSSPGVKNIDPNSKTSMFYFKHNYPIFLMIILSWTHEIVTIELVEGFHQLNSSTLSSKLFLCHQSRKFDICHYSYYISFKTINWIFKLNTTFNGCKNVYTQ